MCGLGAMPRQRRVTRVMCENGGSAAASSFAAQAAAAAADGVSAEDESTLPHDHGAVIVGCYVMAGLGGAKRRPVVGPRKNTMMVGPNDVGGCMARSRTLCCVLLLAPLASPTPHRYSVRAARTNLET